MVFSPSNLLRSGALAWMLCLKIDGWAARNTMLAKQRTVITVLEELLEIYQTRYYVAVDWKNEKLCTVKELNSVEEEQHSSNTFVVVQENNTGSRHNIKVSGISTVSRATLALLVLPVTIVSTLLCLCLCAWTPLYQTNQFKKRRGPAPVAMHMLSRRCFSRGSRVEVFKDDFRAYSFADS